jgi:hypothetical protein
MVYHILGVLFFGFVLGRNISVSDLCGAGSGSGVGVSIQDATSNRFVAGLYRYCGHARGCFAGRDELIFFPPFPDISV